MNDFLDYSEFLPSDLTRSLTLIGDLDATYCDAVQQVHELTSLYGQLPSLQENERRDPVALRREISQFLQKALNQREYAYTEATRLNEVAKRHYARSSIIKRKLLAQPEPPSRDPTPVPVSPSAQRSLHRSYERPAYIRISMANNEKAARSRDRHKKAGPRARSETDDLSDGSGIDAVGGSRRKQKRDRDMGRARLPGVLGTNVHSSIAGISTSNALAQLKAPPPDARPGSKWAPWKRLTEYEMAVLRKQMKKNAVWSPSETMVNRELEKKHRTAADYEREKARCEEAGEALIDEKPEALQDLMDAAGLGRLATSRPAPDAEDLARDDSRDDGITIRIRQRQPPAKEGRKMDRLSQRQQAERDARELEDATSKLQQAADSLKELTFLSHAVSTPASQKKKPATRPSNKRKRDTTPPPATEGATITPQREASVATQDSGTREPEPKRHRPNVTLRLHAPVPSSVASPVPSLASPVSTPQDATASAAESTAASPAAHTPVPVPEPRTSASNESSVQVPLAPAGPSTPKVNKAAPKASSQPPTPVVPLVTETAASPGVTEPVHASHAHPAATAASSRPRRESVAPKAMTPPEAPAPPLKTSKPSSPAPESIPDAPAPAHAHATRPRSSRGHVHTPKAQSEEPKPNDLTRITRETRRHSVFSQSALTAPVPTRMSSRKKPPPKGEVTAKEDGHKTVTNVKRAQGSKNKKKQKPEEDPEPLDDIDSDEEKYCICDDVSYGQMISCDNHVSPSDSMYLLFSLTVCSATRSGSTCPA